MLLGWIASMSVVCVLTIGPSTSLFATYKLVLLLHLNLSHPFSCLILSLPSSLCSLLFSPSDTGNPPISTPCTASEASPKVTPLSCPKYINLP